MYPLKFEPCYQEKVWGGRRLAEVFDKKLPPGLIGESWEIADHPHGQSKIKNGKFAGLTISQVLNNHSKELLGREKTTARGEFPLLVKFLDANQKLSVQVHPDDDYAASQEGGESGKTEMWYILEAEPGAELIYGLKEGTTRRDFHRAVKEKRVVDLLNRIKVHKGDAIFLPPGKVHAICEGIVLAEIQQNSDLTYRIYDWDRITEAGSRRELHIESALDVIDFSSSDNSPLKTVCLENENIQREVLVSCRYFTVEVLNIAQAYQSKTREGYHILNVLAGEGSLLGGNFSEVNLKCGDSFLLPASLGNYQVAGKIKMLKSSPKKPASLKNELLAAGLSPSRIKKVIR